MAVTFSRRDDCYMGYSTDTKPTTIDVNEKFYEYDTSKLFIWTGTEWKEVL